MPGLQVRVVHPAPTCSLPGATSVILLYRKKNMFRIFCPNRDLNGQAESEWIVINFGEKHDCVYSLLVKCPYGRCMFLAPSGFDHYITLHVPRLTFVTVHWRVNLHP